MQKGGGGDRSRTGDFTRRNPEGPRLSQARRGQEQVRERIA